MEGSGVVGPLVWCLYFGKFYSSALTMLLLADGTFDTLLQSFHAFYVTLNASPFGDCVDFRGVLRASFSSPSSDLFSVFCQFYIFWHGWCFFAVNQPDGSLIFYCHGKHAALALTSNGTCLDRPELEQCFLQTPSYAEI